MAVAAGVVAKAEYESVIVEPLRRDVIQKNVILASFKLRLYASRIHWVVNYVFAKVITKETLHNHVFSDDEVEREPTITYLQYS